MTTIANIDFFEYAFAFSNETIQVSCCAPDRTLTNVTCGRGMSCIGQCSAIHASLCLSGKCTENPEDCNLFLEQRKEKGNRKGWSGVTKPSWQKRWCHPKCNVGKHSECCFHQACYAKKQKKCDWKNFFVLGLYFYIYSQIMVKTSFVFRKLLSKARAHSEWKVDLFSAGNSHCR